MVEVNEDLVKLEAALYVAGRPVTLEELSNIIDKAESTTRKLLENLGFEYRQREGALEVVELPRERYVLQLKPELTPGVAKLIPGGLLSFATLQTLVYIALKQPILQSELVAERGTHCYDHIKELIEKKFVDAVPEGRSRILTTTDLFADYFGLDPDRVRLKAQLKFKMKRILSEQQELEDQAAAEEFLR
ncbi:MAG: SMC-Scp complex subunit ScpB [Candidatus Thorarchaeota archaeon]|nr:SMC-Scp complex subunit ScpB [Candidatus Thorarchaeota archaeon]